MVLALVGCVVFIVYGSLVPLDYRPLPLDDAWERFQRTPFLVLGVGSRADWIANGVLYLPLGALATLWLRRVAWPSWLAVATTLVFGIALAFAVEFAQLFFPPRTVSQNDLIAEAIGLALGALAGLWIFRRGEALQVPLQAGRAWLAAHGFAVYTALYVAYSLFPYDLLLSVEEFRHKLDSDLWGWWLAGQGRRTLHVALLLVVEAALTVPIGVWLARRLGLGPLGAVVAGLVFGALMEAAQFLIATGSSQGASVVARTLGVTVGALLWRERGRWRVDDVRRVVARHAARLGAGYVALLLAVNGWFTYSWQGVAAAQAKWSQLRLLPFYYHYYTSEAQALVSFATVSLMYAPLGALVWVRGGSASLAGIAAAVLALVVEASKLFMAGQRPDPTNVLIAAAAAATLVALMRWAMRPMATVTSATTVVHERRRQAAVGHRRPASAAWLALPVVLLVVHLWLAPALAVATALLVVVCAAAVWWRPPLALFLAAALLPALDLAAWTGRRAFDEFDLLLAACLAAGFVRTPRASRQRRNDGPWLLVSALLAVSLLLSTLRGLLSADVLGAEALLGYHAPTHGLWVVKGWLWAVLFVALARRVESAGAGAWPALSAGMTAGLAWVVAFVVWERAAFVGLFDFAQDYRTTGPFSAMHRGGAFVECYLAVAVPFAASWLLRAPQVWLRAMLALLLAGAGYAVFVTYSRNGYAAVAVGLVTWTVLASRSGGAAVPWWRLAIVPVALAAASVPVLLGSYAQERLANWRGDLAVRQAHWADALAIRDPGVLTAVLGMGVGTFPATHFWRSAEPVRAATFALGGGDGTPYLRLGGGALTYLDQVVARPAGGRAQLTVQLRANVANARVAVSLCEKWMLTSRRCAEAQVVAGPVANRWAEGQATLDLSVFAEPAGPVPRSVKFALHSPAAGVVVDVAQLWLVADDGSALIVNGDFARGLDRWLFSTNVDPPYHVHSLPVSVLFEQGWFGIVAWGLLLGAALARGIALAWQGSLQATTAVAAVVAFLASATLNTLIDEPRFLGLLLVCAWCCMVAWRGDGPKVAAALQPVSPASPVSPVLPLATK